MSALTQAMQYVVCPQWLEYSRRRVEQIYTAEMNRPGSPVNPKMVRLNLNHIERVVGNAAAIAAGERMDARVLELAAILHDIAKLDYRETLSGGIDRWHHHHRSAVMAERIILVELQGPESIAERIGLMIEKHSDIPLIRRYWDSRCEPLPGPSTAEEYALRDADVIDMLWVGGLANIIQARQIPESDLYGEDEGDILKAIASARRNYEETRDCLKTATAKFLARERIATVETFLEGISRVRSLEEFREIYQRFVLEKETVRSHPYH